MPPAQSACVMKRIALSLLLALTSAPYAAAASEPRAEVASRAHTLDVYAQARAQLERDRSNLNGRAQQLSQEIAEAKRDRSLLSDAQLKARLREALEVARQLEATDRKLAQLDRMTRDSAGALQALVSDHRLTAAERAAAESAARRALLSLPAAVAGPELDIHVNAGMDADALRERADLAQDYEEKLRREAARADARIRELEATASIAGEAAHLSSDRRLFDEEDRTMHGSRVVNRVASPAKNTTGGTQGGADESADLGGRSTSSGGGGTSTGGPQEPGSAGNSAGGGGAPAAGSAGQAPPSGAMQDGDYSAGTGGGGTTAPPANPGTTTTGTGHTDSLMPRSQTVVDERTFALLRESRAPMTDLSPADELRQLQTRREALLRQAARMRALRDDLDGRARAARGSQQTR